MWLEQTTIHNPGIEVHVCMRIFKYTHLVLLVSINPLKEMFPLLIFGVADAGLQAVLPFWGRVDLSS